MKQLAIFVAACSFVVEVSRLCDCAVRTIGQRHKVSLVPPDCAHRPSATIARSTGYTPSTTVRHHRHPMAQGTLGRHHTKSRPKKMKKIQVATDFDRLHQICCFLTLRLLIVTFRCLQGVVVSKFLWCFVVFDVELSSTCCVELCQKFQKNCIAVNKYLFEHHFEWFLSCIVIDQQFVLFYLISIFSLFF